jgi:hypothetical protein
LTTCFCRILKMFLYNLYNFIYFICLTKADPIKRPPRMLQLDSIDTFNGVAALTEKLRYGRDLMSILTSDPDSSQDRFFTVVRNRNQTALPLLFAESERVSKKFRHASKMPQAVKKELKRQLQLDIDAIVARIKNYVDEPKMVNAQLVDAVDLDGCSSKLQELSNEKLRQIEALKEEVDSIAQAESTLQMIRELKQKADGFGVDFLEAMPSPSASEAARALKRQKKNGD